MKISFIIPIYKVEPYLDQCVDSVLFQTYQDIEVILVDDGSPDYCPQKCDVYKIKDSRVRVLHKSNGGLSDARNAGLQIASGDYIIFMDGDDMWLGKNSLENIVSFMHNYPECNFYGFNCQYYYPDTDTYKKWVPYTDDVLLPIDGSSAMISLVKTGTVPMSACLKVVERKWLIDKKIIFKIGQLSEDIPWFINLLDKCEKCIFKNDYIYAYRQNRVGSISSSAGERSFNSVLDIIKTELELINERLYTSEAKDALRSFLAYEVCILMSMVCRLPKEKRFVARSELKKLSWLFKYPQNPKVRLVSHVYNMFGYAITERVLRFYNWYRTKV